MVNTYTWFIHDGRKGMQGMSLEERAVYRDLLDLIYFRDGNVPDDDTEIARWISCDVRVWKRIKAALIARDRIVIRDGVVHDSKCDTRLASEVARATSFREKSLLGGQATRERWDRINGTANGTSGRSKPRKSRTYDSPTASPQASPQASPTASPRKTAPGLAPLIQKESKSSFGSTSEHLQPSAELIKHELNTRPRPPGLLATALVDSALARPATSEPEPSEGQASEESTPPIARAPPQPANPEAKFSRAEVGKPQGWDLGPRHAKPHQLADLGADPPQKPPSTQTNGGFYAAAGSKELKAWQEHYAEIDKGIRLDEAGGWKYPSQWPPGHAA